MQMCPVTAVGLKGRITLRIERYKDKSSHAVGKDGEPGNKIMVIKRKNNNNDAC